MARLSRAPCDAYCSAGLRRSPCSLAGALAARAQSYEEALAQVRRRLLSRDRRRPSPASPPAATRWRRRSSRRCRTAGCCSAPTTRRSTSATAPARLLDAATGKPVASAEPADLKPVRVNNRLRRAIEAALGGLTLLSPDPGKRFEAAEAVFKSKDASRAAHARSRDRQGDRRRASKRALEEARAAVDPVGKHDAERDRQGRGHQRAPRPRRPGRPRRAGRPARRPADRRAAASLPTPSPPSTTGWRSGTWRRTSGTGSRSARCCCWPPSASPSPSASWASSTWRMARW